ncbi:MAG: AAA family ATPase [Gemmatimonadaceae bacterium]|nr:AAA family ATPase [Gemmatimonadaceae bacterium]
MLIVIFGLPGSGKSTLGRALARELEWPAVDKDDFLERQLDDEMSVTAERRRILSRLSDLTFREVAQSLARGVLVSCWSR